MASIKQYFQTCKFKLDYFCVSEVTDILTEALPGDQFVSIDGKKTYFDIGPSNAPGGKIVKKKIENRISIASMRSSKYQPIHCRCKNNKGW